MIGKAIAGEAKATFFYISASSLTSKWVNVDLFALIVNYCLPYRFFIFFSSNLNMIIVVCEFDPDFPANV